MDQPKRRLSAVWFADIVGYTSLSARDEPAALRLVGTLQAQAREIVASHEGRVVKFIGDAVLAEFSSTDSAVRAAVSLQERYCAEPESERHGSRLRVGVHLGEVTATNDGDLYGDGINTAARLQQEAEPGQVIISEDVWRQLRQRPEFRFAALGAVELRGITTRVGLYDVLFGARAALSTPPDAAQTRPAARRGSRTVILAAVAAIVLASAGVLAYMWLRTPLPDSAPVAASTPPSAATTGAAAPSAATPPLPPSSGNAASGPREKPTPRAAAPSLAPARQEQPDGQRAATTTVVPTIPDPGMAMTNPTPAEGPDESGRGNVRDAPAIRDLIERLVTAFGSDQPRQALAALGPGAAAMSGRSGQQMHQQFGDGLTLRVGRIDPRGMRGNGMAIRFFLLAKSDSRAETPIAFDAVIVRAGTALQFAELHRSGPRRGGGD